MADLPRIVRPIFGAALLAVAGASTANAVPVLWTLSNFVMSDGGTALGSFVYDADANAYSAIDVTTTAGTARPGDHFTQLSLGIQPDPTQVLFVEDGTGADQTGAAAFAMFFAAALTNAGGSVLLEQGQEASCAAADCVSPAEPHRLIYGGNLAGTALAVSEPAGATVLLAGLAALGLLRRRRATRDPSRTRW